jgi:hypothetical protein
MWVASVVASFFPMVPGDFPPLVASCHARRGLQRNEPAAAEAPFCHRKNVFSLSMHHIENTNIRNNSSSCGTFV